MNQENQLTEQNSEETEIDAVLKVYIKGKKQSTYVGCFFYRKNISERIFIFIYNKIYDQIQD